MGNYGIKASRIGYDVDNASDRQLALSSDWALLPLDYEDSYKITSTNLTVPIASYSHGLGYPPVFISWLEDTTGKILSANPFAIPIHCSSTQIIFNEGNVLPTSDYVGWTIHYKVFRRSLLTETSAENINVNDATKEEDEDYGIKVSLPTKDVDSSDDRDFSIRSDRRQLIIHKSGVTDYTVVRTFTFTVSASSSGKTLISTTSVFTEADIGKTLINTIDSVYSEIVGYTNGTTVTMRDTIGDTWDGDFIATQSDVTMRVEHDSDYLPMFFAFLNWSGSGEWQPFAHADDAYTTVDDEYLDFTSFYDDMRWAYVIFKDTLTENG